MRRNRFIVYVCLYLLAQLRQLLGELLQAGELLCRRPLAMLHAVDRLLASFLVYSRDLKIRLRVRTQFDVFPRGGNLESLQPRLRRLIHEAARCAPALLPFRPEYPPFLARFPATCSPRRRACRVNAPPFPCGAKGEIRATPVAMVVG